MGTAQAKTALVRYRQSTPSQECPYGSVERLVTAGEGGVANIHVVTVTKGLPHVHSGYDEVYYVLSGSGTLQLGGEARPLRPGAVAVIPAGVEHALRKFEEGTYGLCDSCGQPIDPARLEALPQASLCLSCKAKQAKDAKHKSSSG